MIVVGIESNLLAHRLDVVEQVRAWSIPDPVAVGSAAAFDDTVRELRQRIDGLVERTGQS